ncbi:MAG: alpha/beta fold hydrolase [Rhodospirillaceae bacterium]
MRCVLIHGAWHGAWVWKATIQHLNARGHISKALDLSGLQERGKPGPILDVGLDDHIEEVCSWLNSDENKGEPVVLVGHSYAGMVITGVADRCQSKIAKLVYIDAYVPDNFMAWRHFHSAERASGRIANAISFPSSPDVKFIEPPLGRIMRDALGIPDLAMAQKVEDRLRLHPLKTYVQPINLKDPPSNIEKVYIDCVGNQTALWDSDFDELKSRIRCDKNWTYLQIESGHDVMVTHPEELANLLAALLTVLPRPK